ncbi:MAG: hypothetical protein KF901_31835 [Myxococcales bacterium]|nr:hypothetical protein [Myxococcales bacterium]
MDDEDPDEDEEDDDDEDDDDDEELRTELLTRPSCASLVAVAQGAPVAAATTTHDARAR